jgi:hypothetical protein
MLIVVFVSLVFLLLSSSLSFCFPIFYPFLFNQQHNDTSYFCLYALRRAPHHLMPLSTMFVTVKNEFSSSRSLTFSLSLFVSFSLYIFYTHAGKKKTFRITETNMSKKRKSNMCVCVWSAENGHCSLVVEHKQQCNHLFDRWCQTRSIHR